MVLNVLPTRTLAVRSYYLLRSYGSTLARSSRAWGRRSNPRTEGVRRREVFLRLELVRAGGEELPRLIRDAVLVVILCWYLVGVWRPRRHGERDRRPHRQRELREYYKRKARINEMSFTRKHSSTNK